jgi:hypothetical protein
MAVTGLLMNVLAIITEQFYWNRVIFVSRILIPDRYFAVQLSEPFPLILHDEPADKQVS